MIDHLVVNHPSLALDVGCSTGKVATALSRRGVHVVGVEPDERMAQVPRNHGVQVAIASFETWHSKGQLFDLITCGHAWHWIDPAAGLPKAASLLRPGGTIELFWNYHVLDQSVLEHIDPAYQALRPDQLNALQEAVRRIIDQRTCSFWCSEVSTTSGHVVPRLPGTT